MSLKNIILKSMATTMAISIVWGNISICGRGISKVIAENIAAPETEIELTNEKYVQYQNEEYAGVAVHSKLSVYPKQERNTYLPTQSVVAQVSLPRINGYLPERASVVEASTIATTGESQNTKVQQAYDVSSGLLVLSYENIPDQEGNLYAQFNENVKDEFEIIYIYPAEAYTGNEKAIDLNYAVNVKTSFQTGNEIITSQNEKNIKITEKENKKEITTFHITQLQGSIYKGFLYSNVENKTDYETKYKTVATFAVLNHQVINESILKLEEGSFILNNQEQTKIAANGMIEYEATGVSKYEFDRILGQEGKIEFYQGENVLATIQYVEIDHTKKLAVIYADGNMTILDDAETSAIIQYPKEVTALEIKISKPITEGFLHFENQNKIKASHDYGVAVKEIKKIRKNIK